MNRIQERFAAIKKSGRKAFVAYIAAGDPHPEATPDLVCALERAGTDIVELGIPFSDPLADGVVNQLAAQRALLAGTTPAGVLDIVRRIRKRSQIPIVFFTYLNPIFHYGLEKFYRDAAQAGADGILLLDLPPEEATAAVAAGTQHGLCNIWLIAPTTPEERVRIITQRCSGFVYYVSREGVTGMQSQIPETIQSQISLIRKYTSVPICVGFGVSNPDQAHAIARIGDGVVVGSAIVNRIGEWGKENDLSKRLESFAKPFAEAIHTQA